MLSVSLSYIRLSEDNFNSSDNAGSPVQGAKCHS
jgi:hypothetical protein